MLHMVVMLGGNKRDYGALWYIVVAKNSVYKEIKANETNMQLLHLKSH